MKLPSQVEHLVNRASLEYAFTALARPLLAGLTVAEPVLNGGDCLLRSKLSKPPLMLSAQCSGAILPGKCHLKSEEKN